MRSSVTMASARAGAALLLSFVTLLAGATGAGADPGDPPGALTPLTAASDLAKTALIPHQDAPSTLTQLDSEMPVVDASDVLASANHPMRNLADCASTETAALPINPSASSAYCWDSGDADTQLWLPQSVTSSGDASADGLWHSHKVLLSGWSYNTSTDPAGHDATKDDWARVAFIDADNPSALSYRWVLLVVPTSGGTDFRPLVSHLGGMVWYGDKLIVTASNGDADYNALYVFSMSQILQATVNSSSVGKVTGGYSADSYQYVMPAIGSYSYATAQKCTSTDDTHLPCLASVSLDRSSNPPSLVANEWFSSGGTTPARLLRYGIGSAGDYLLDTNSSGQAVAEEVEQTAAVGLQGALSHNGEWYVDDARGGVNQHGILWRLDASGSSAATCTSDIAYACWAQHSEGMSLWWSTQTVWSLTEWAANSQAKWIAPAVPQRVLFSVPLSALD
ncbi:hypothetical protein ABUW04_18930 [Streptacidiphilus sp. N1-10]|uniref:Secreted protein n=1 Tax=Streptacidiphilus jeojiensis TaxID=3229225 RepID=A0ABV6XPY3_9ACTN